KSVIPGLVMVHEHLFYPTGSGVYGNVSESFTRLYLAGGVTSMRTGGNMNGYGELNIAKAIARGDKPGPWIDATAPYVNGPNPFGQMRALETPAEARRFTQLGQRAIRELELCGKPVIAAINGFAFGGVFFDEAACEVSPTDDGVVAGHQYLYDFAKAGGPQEINAF
ncbi:MAG: hypothetical protein ACLGIK_00480, partial [Gemmatimonadota bacterium]